MGSKPVVAMALSRAVHEQMFARDDLEDLSAVATVLDPPLAGVADQLTPLLKEAVVAVTGWGTASFDTNLLTAAPKLQLIAHSAGSVKAVVTDAVYDRGIRVTTSA